jgi:hypothetical protein
MATPAAVTVRPLSDDLGLTPTGNDSAVSWGSIFVGAAAAASLSLLLVVLGFGLGLSSISPWSQHSASAETIGVSTILWIALTQIAASALGGYLAGRLRVKWARLHTDEVYFRDTAHGFMAWAVATLVTAAFLASAMSAAIGGSVKAGAAITQGITSGAGSAMMGAQSTNAAQDSSPSSYFVGSMFRGDPNSPSDPAAAAAAVRDATPIVAYDLRTGSMSAADRTYLGQLVAKQTGLSQPDAEKRVSDAFGQLQSAIATTEETAKQTAEKARKAAAYSALWTFIALLCGAFFASLAATFGGRRRDLFA